jgi:hypothetical protein
MALEPVWGFGDVIRAGGSGGHALVRTRTRLAAFVIVGMISATVTGIVSRASTPPAGASDPGYWLVSRAGEVSAFGDAAVAGSLGGHPPALPVVGMGPTPTGRGYRLVASDGGVFAFGDASFLGSTGAVRLSRPVVGMATRPAGDGYWLVASDGGIFAFGDAAFAGSTGGMHLNTPVVGMAATPTGRGYWLVASDGGIFAFGDAGFLGSMGGRPLTRPIVGMAATRTGRGYWLVASDGGIFAFGDAGFAGSMGGHPLALPVVGMAATRGGHGYWLVASDGGLFAFGDAPFLGSGGLTAAAVAVGGGLPTQSAANSAPPAGGPTGSGGSSTSDPSVSTTTVPLPAAAPSAPFQIGAIGDTGYSSSQDAALLKVRKSMAGRSLAFTVHDGDIQLEGSPCTDQRLNYVKGVFDGFAAPFIFTPGDNEWNNCSDSKGRLAAVRRIFFPTNETLGQRRFTVERLSPAVENARWQVGGVYFATLNVPGPSGGGNTAVNNAWLNATFDAAEAAGAPGVMIVWQDNPFADGTSGTLIATLKRRATAFGRPVVLVHGDTHSHTLDHPWKDVPNFTRLETYSGADGGRWVLVTVDPASPQVFSFSTVTAR